MPWGRGVSWRQGRAGTSLTLFICIPVGARLSPSGLFMSLDLVPRLAGSLAPLSSVFRLLPQPGAQDAPVPG